MPAKKKISPDETSEPVAPAEPPADSISDQATMFAAAPAVVPPAPVPPPPPFPPTAPTVQPLSPSDERTWAMLSHLSVLLNLVTGFGGPIAAFIIYLIYKDRSRYVAYHSLQAAIFQLIWWFGGGVIASIAWAISGALTAVVVGLLCMPFACLITLLPLGAIVYGIVGGVQTSQGQDFKYWLIGDWMRGTLNG
jgi:uncharacterized Tic20 family protein